MTTRIYTHDLFLLALGVAPFVGCDPEFTDTDGLAVELRTEEEAGAEEAGTEEAGAEEGGAEDDALFEEPLLGLDFGGAYGYVNDVPVPNPATGGASCPYGYTSTKVLGTSGVDYEVNFCSRPRQKGVAPLYDFGGMWGYVGGVAMNNPITHAASCPAGYTDQTILGTSGVDYPVHVCYTPHIPLVAPVTRFGGMWGHVEGAPTANPATGAASCPTGFMDTQVLHNSGVDWALHFCALPREEDFGGAYGYADGAAVPNPATGGASCPYGYTSTMVLGTPNVDHQVYFCSRQHREGVDPVYDFGGMWGHVNGAVMNNPISNATACPTGYTEQRILGTHGVDYSLSVCYRAHGAGEEPAALFGGMWGHVNGVPTANPVTGAASCPVGYTDTRVLGTVNVDWDLHVCTVPSRRPTDRAACTAPGQKPCAAEVQRVGSVPYLNCTYGFHTGLEWGSSTSMFYDQIDRCAFLHDNGCWKVNHLTWVNEGNQGCSQTVNFMGCVDQIVPASAEEAAAKDCIQNSMIAVGANICEPLHWLFGRGHLYPLYDSSDQAGRCSSGWYFDGLVSKP